MSEISKQICPGFNLKIKKRLSEYLIDFILDNTTDFVFLLRFLIKDPVQVKSLDGEYDKNVKVFPQSHYCFMQLQIEGSFSYSYEYKYQKLSMDPIEKNVNVTENLYICITQTDMEKKIVFELINDNPFKAHFELTVIELSGIRTIDGKSLFVVDISPNSRCFVCELQFDGVWSYKYSFIFSFEEESPPEDLH